jgi:PTH2 family peptidyl-tRNA hydrolase
VGGSPFEYKMCIVLRLDLGMSTGKLIAQACHAAVGASELGKKENHKAWRRWRDEGAKKVALEVESLEEIEELAEKANELDIVNILIQDAGHTEVPPGTVTALGLGPDRTDLLDKVTGSLHLIRRLR